MRAWASLTHDEGTELTEPRRLGLEPRDAKNRSLHWGVGPEAIKLRKQAANVAGVDVESLPSCAQLSGLVEYLFMLLASHVTTGGLSKRVVTTFNLQRVCQRYDSNIPIEALHETFKAVGGLQGLDHTALYLWVAMMWSDCGVEGFLTGVDQFAEVAKSMTKFNELLSHGVVQQQP